MAQRLRIRVGDVVDARAVSSGEDLTLEVVALLDGLSPLGPVAVAASDMARIAPERGVSVLLVHGASGASSAAVADAVRRAVADSPAVVTLSAAQSAEQWNDSIETLRTLLFALLGLSVVIAFFSLANTLALSVVERTGELALLRALGLTRRQLSRTLAAESGIMSLIGVGVGTGLGVVVGWALSNSVTVVSEVRFAISVPFVLSFVVAGAVVGLVAGTLPTRQAAKAPIVAALRRQ